MLFTLPTHSAKKVSSANLTRSFRRAPKHAGEADDGVVGAGLCHLCVNAVKGLTGKICLLVC